MAYSEQVINGVTKTSQESGVFVYRFPIALLTADNNDSFVNYQIFSVGSNPIANYTIPFADISITYGATDPESYCDAVAAIGAYSNRVESSTGTGQISILQNRVVVTQASQLTGTLDPTKEYFLDGIIDMTGTSGIDRTGLSTLKITGYDFNLSGLVCGDDNFTMISGTGGGDVILSNFQFITSGVNSKAYDLTGDNTNSFESSMINYNNCTSRGEITDFRQGFEAMIGMFGGKPTLTLSGSWNGFRTTDSIVRGISNTGVSEPLFKAGTGFTMSGSFKTNLNVDLGTDAPFSDFAPSNFSEPNVYNLDGMRVFRNGVVNGLNPTDYANTHPNINENDLASEWANNKGLPNTNQGGRQTVTAETVNTIATQGVYEDVQSTFTPAELVHTDSPLNGEIRHLEKEPRDYSLSGLFRVGGTQNDELEMLFQVFRSSSSTFEDIISQRSDVTASVGNNDVAQFIFINFKFTMNNNDYVNVPQIRNNSGGASCTVLNDSYFSIQKL